MSSRWSRCCRADLTGYCARRGDILLEHVDWGYAKREWQFRVSFTTVRLSEGRTPGDVRDRPVQAGGRSMSTTRTQ